MKAPKRRSITRSSHGRTIVRDHFWGASEPVS